VSPQITTVLFDLDGTLRHSDPNGFETFVDYLAELGHRLPAERVMAGRRWVHYYWSMSPESLADFHEFGDETPEFWLCHTERQLRAVGIEGERADLTVLKAQIGKLFEERYRPVHRVPDDVIPTLERLRDLGYTVALVSNRSDPLEALALELGLAGHFQFMLSAGQASAWKPDPAIFLKAVAMAGCSPPATAYVGDNYYADVVGARAAGVWPVLIDPLGIFPDAGCPIIRSLSELEPVLAQIAPDGVSQAPA
jgi:HAD superfamily hydrolase (TIGR01509 family)